MDLEQKRRKQSLKIIISEAVMVIAVIFMVVVLAFIVSGYWVNPDFQIERQGLLQVSSIPTGADVQIDDASSWLQKTNTSKVLASGNHTIKLSKEGYDTWSKNIDISEGLLYRLNYPRLFLKKREKEEVLTAVGTITASVSPNRETMVLTNNTNEWSLVNLKNDTITSQKLNLSNIFSEDLFTGEILDSNWDRDNAHILFKISTGDSIEWVLVDVNNPANSLNLTKSFGYNFDRVKIISNSSNILLATQNGNLHKIDLSSKSISTVLVENVVDFDYYYNKVIFSVSDNSSDNFKVGLLELSNNKITDFKDFAVSPRVIIGKFYEDQYFAVIIDDVISLYKVEDFSEFGSFELSFSPAQIKVGHDSDFILAYDEDSFATIDMESSSLKEWTAENNDFGWLDNYMVYTVADGELIVRDYDGLNRRVLADNVSSRLPVTITNDKWLYYFSDDVLVREWLIPR